MDKRFTPAILDLCRAQQRKHGIPTSVTAAQWAIESAYGTRMPAGSNNPFGIKAALGQASVAATTREVRGGVSDMETARFAAFASLADAFDAHSAILLHPLYAAAMKAWLAGDLKNGVVLMAQHYATDPDYATTVMSVIASNGLADIDHEVALEFTAPPAAPASAAAPAAAKTVSAPAAAAPAPSTAAAKALTVSNSSAAATGAPGAAVKTAALNTSSVNVLAGLANVFETMINGVESSVAAAFSKTTAGAVAAATNGNAIVGSVSDGEAAIADVRQAIADARAGKWSNEPHDVLDFATHVLAILSRFGIVLPAGVNVVVSALKDMVPVAAAA